MNSELKDLLQLLEDDLDDLEKWSAYHDDQFNYEINQIAELIKQIKGE